MINEKCPEAFISPRMSFFIFFSISYNTDKPHTYHTHTHPHFSFNFSYFMSCIFVSFFCHHSFNKYYNILCSHFSMYKNHKWDKCNFFLYVYYIHNSKIIKLELEEYRTNEFNYAFHYIANYSALLLYRYLSLEYFQRDFFFILTFFIIKN